MNDAQPAKFMPGKYSWPPNGVASDRESQFVPYTCAFVRNPMKRPSSQIARRTKEQVQTTDRIVRRVWGNDGSHIDLTALNNRLQKADAPQFASTKQFQNYKCHLKTRIDKRKKSTAATKALHRVMGKLTLKGKDSKDRSMSLATFAICSYVILRHCFQDNPSLHTFTFTGGTLSKAWFTRFVAIKGASLTVGASVPLARKNAWLSQFSKQCGKATTMGGLRALAQLHPATPMPRDWLAHVPSHLLGLCIYMQSRLRSADVGEWWMKHMASQGLVDFDREHFRKSFQVTCPKQCSFLNVSSTTSETSLSCCLMSFRKQAIMSLIMSLHKIESQCDTLR